MIVVGIDPGLKATGYSFVEYKNRQTQLLETGTIEPKQKDLIQHRIAKIYDILNELLSQYQPNVLVLEKLYTHSARPTVGIKLGHVRGVICLLCAQHKIELVEHSVKRIRQALTGNGNATKLQTQRVVTSMFNIQAEKMPLDASDAMALALGYIRMNERHI